MATRKTVGRRALQGGEGAGSYGRYWRGLGVVIALWAAVVPASARSTLSARLDQPAIAGPALDQQSILYLHYFPGDGEAIISADLRCLGNAQLQSVRSALGKAQLEAASIGIDYAARPLAGEHIDTLYIDLVAAELGTIGWSAAIHSSLAPQGTPAHQIEFDLAVRPPPAISWSIEPQRVYQGEHFDLRAIVRLDDTTGPPLEELNWTWPPELSWPEGDAPQRWSGSLTPGQADTLSWTVLVDPTHLGPLPLTVAAQVSGQSPVDLATQHLQVDPLPVMALEPGFMMALETGFMEVGKRGPVTCIWRNESADPIALAALRLQVAPAFSDVSLVEGPPGAALVRSDEEAAPSLLVSGLDSLGAGAAIRVTLEAVPQRPGPFTWQSACKPVGREHFIPLHGANTVRVVWPGTAQAPGGAQQTPTDLQLINQAFVRALDHQMDALPLSPGTRLFLQAEDDKNEANWVVEDALIETLQQRGYQVLVRQPEDAPADVVYYRLVRARVVYSPAPRRLLLWGNEQQREAYGDLFLRIETAADHIVRWDRRVQAYSSDMVSKGLSGVLGGDDMVEQTVLKPENKAIVRGLSAGILGGLFYIFFVL
ncbi:MAG: hypothetical protein F4Z57_09705 [Gemmatimonadetes bacterium]|nr:hypothetical protein [Gemmatimonadota bacterium]MYC72835.1 hypothetical protein [Gemmatimonadota bacterium]MYI63903.1 hypothetical protein [Gemmatimonadota bacterium]